MGRSDCELTTGGMNFSTHEKNSVLHTRCSMRNVDVNLNVRYVETLSWSHPVLVTRLDALDGPVGGSQTAAIRQQSSRRGPWQNSCIFCSDAWSDLLGDISPIPSHVFTGLRGVTLTLDQLDISHIFWPLLLILCAVERVSRLLAGHYAA